MRVTITLDDSLARQLEQQASLRNISLEEWAVEQLKAEAELRRQEAVAAEERKQDHAQWNDKKNARRCDLIDKQIEGTITPAELDELDELQSQLSRHLDEVAPFDLAGARKIHRQLLQKKRAIQSKSRHEFPT